MQVTITSPLCRKFRHTAQIDPAPVILAIIRSGKDCKCLQDVALAKGWKLIACQRLEEAKSLFGLASIVIAEDHFSDGSWKDVLRQLDAAAEGPLLVVASHAATEQLWAEVLNWGAYDLLAEPFLAQEVIRTVTVACYSMRRGSTSFQKVEM